MRTAVLAHGGPATVAESLPSRDRVAIFLPDLALGGVERVMAHLANGLRAEDWEVDLLTGQPDGPALAYFDEGVAVRRLRGGRTRYLLYDLARQLRSTAYGALIAAKEYGNVAAVLAAHRTGTPVIATVHSPPGPSAAQGLHIGTYRPRRLIRFAYRHAASVVAVARGVANDLENDLSLDASVVRVIENPVIGPRAGDAVRCTPPHPWLAPRAGDARTLVAVGRLCAEKDVATLLRALTRLPANHRLVIVGDGPERDDLDEQAAKLAIAERVAFVGAQPDALAFIAHADAVVSSSRLEGLPTVLIEALALKRQVVATDCQDGPRDVLADGRLGRLVPVGDDSRLADAIVDALCSPLPIDESALDRFRVETAVRRYSDLLHATVGAR